MNETRDKSNRTAETASSDPKPKKSTSRHSEASNDLIIVGIGASAGGLDALQRVLPGLPTDAGMAYIIVQHLAPKHRSLLSSLLAKHTNMAVETISDGMLVRANTIYITPPNKDVTLSRNRLKLSKASSIGPRPSIDYFFNSLAEEKGAHAVGIILSGTGTDGSHGIRAIKSNDGITMAQTVESAKFDGMPQAAIGTGLVDLVLPPEDIGHEIENALKYPNLIAKAPTDMHADKIGDILERLLLHTGVDFRDYKQTTIQRRISRRMVIHKKENLLDYISYIRKNPEELSVLQKDLLISVTSFFRDAQAFEALSHHLANLLSSKKPGDTFRAWVPGCSTGEEAYTIAILVAEILGKDLAKYRIQIFATDLDEESVQLARKGVYPLATVMETDGRRFEKHFSHRDNTVTVKKQIRDMVILAKQDLIKDTPFLHLDLISCRNLMIYLNSELQDKLLSLFQFSLNPDGLLFLGKSESINKRLDLFKAVDNRWKIYQRKESPVRRFPKLMQVRHMDQLTAHRANVKGRQADGSARETVVLDALVGLLDFCAVHTDENANILYIRGDVAPYFKFPQGRVRENLNAVEVARPEIRYVLQSLLHKSVKEEGNVTSNPIFLGENESGVRIRVGPFPKNTSQNHRLIVFWPAETPKPRTRTKSSPEEYEHERVHELEQELEVTREHLQDTIEELETSSEELQSLNEELQSANEELQASNEELETSNEELQASNEELNTVNDELRAKSEEAAELLEDFKNSEKRYRLLVDNMNEAIMSCALEYGPRNQPTDLIIQQANRAMEKLFGIDGSHQLPVRAGTLDLDELVTPKMLAKFVQIAEGGDARRFEVRLGAVSKDLTLSVYPLGKGRVGMVLRDDTERNRAEAALQVREARYRQLVQNANTAIIRWKVDGTITFLNEYAQKFFGYSLDEALGKPVNMLLPESDSSGDDLTGLVRDIVAAPEKFENNINENVCSDGRRVWMTWANRPIFNDDGEVVEILAVGTDITERRKAEQALKESEQLYRTIGETIPYGVWITDAAGSCIYVSASFLDMAGLTMEEAREFGWLHILPPEDREATREHWLQSVATGRAFEREHRFKAKDGAYRYVLAIGRPVYNQKGKITHWAGINLDITDHKQAEMKLEKLNESLEKKVAERTALAENRAAQLRALTVELIEAEERERRRVAQLLHDDLQQLLASARLQLQAACPTLPEIPELANVEKLLDDSIGKARRLSHELSPPMLNHAGLVPALQWLIHQMKEQFDLKVMLELDPDDSFGTSPVNVFVFRAVQELLFNIVKHAGVKSAQVGLKKSGDDLVITVCDDGRGFDRNLLQNVAKPNGFGLLSLEERARSIGGSLDIESHPGNGSRFTLQIPLILADTRIPSSVETVRSDLAPVADRPAAGESLGTRILFADDHKVMRQGLIGLLEGQPDIQVVGEAANGRQALELARQLQPEVVVMDVSMPEMDGIEATRRIKAELPDVRVIGLSMHEDEQIAAMMREAGAEAFVSKTASASELLKAIYQIAGR